MGKACSALCLGRGKGGFWTGVYGVDTVTGNPCPELWDCLVIVYTTSWSHRPVNFVPSPTEREKQKKPSHGPVPLSASKTANKKNARVGADPIQVQTLRATLGVLNCQDFCRDNIARAVSINEGVVLH